VSARIFQNSLLVLWSLVLFACAMGLNTRHNDFPYFYHPDEPGKVEQVLGEKWNFHHPMLLLNASRWLWTLHGGGGSEQDVVEAGRWVSAAFAGGAVVAFSLLAFVWRGWPGAFTAGGTLLLHHQFYELAHYMKEDPALLMGLAFTFLGAALYYQSPSAPRAAFLGVACALAISGKYVGCVALALAVPVLWRRKTPRAGAWFGGALLVALVVINLPLLSQVETFTKSFGREMDFVVNGHRGVTRGVPHAQYWNVFLDNSTPVIWFFLAVFLWARWRDWRSLNWAEWGLIVFPFVYAAVLSFSPKSNDRYFLPASGVLTLLAVLGVEDAAHLLAGRVERRVVLSVGAALLLLFQCTGWSASRPGLWQYDAAFQEDDLQSLLAWIRAELPAEAVIVKDNRVGLPEPRRKKESAYLGPIPQKVLAKRYAADWGSLDQLRAQGVTHVIVSESDYGKFFLKSLRPQKDEEPEFLRRKTFYEELFRSFSPVWERDRGTVIYLHPGIRVYRIAL
jgi:hypothetical protein